MSLISPYLPMTPPSTAPPPTQLAKALSNWRLSSDAKVVAMRVQRERLPAHNLSEAVVQACAKSQVGI